MIFMPFAAKSNKDLGAFGMPPSKPTASVGNSNDPRQMRNWASKTQIAPLALTPYHG
jgi:hypothetical protein